MERSAAALADPASSGVYDRSVLLDDRRRAVDMYSNYP
jgi:hypothetical protein